MDVRTACDQYLRWLATTRDLSPHTLRAYEGDLRALNEHMQGSPSLTALTAESLLRFIEDQSDRGLKPRSIRRRASAIRGFSAWLSANGLLSADPANGLRVRAGRGRNLPRALPAHDLDQLLVSLRRAARVDDRAVHIGVLADPQAATTLLGTTIMLTTGLRVSETVGIRCSDVDTRTRTVRVLGKGRREREVYLTNDWMCDLTQAYLVTRATRVVRHDQLLFNSHDEPLTAAALRSRLAKAAAFAGLTNRVTPHMLRHTAATQLVEAGVDIRYVQRLLGHSSISTTEIYTFVSDGALRATVERADVLGRSAARDN